MNATSFLQDGEICILTLITGDQIEGAWNSESGCFHVFDDEQVGKAISNTDVAEWRPYQRDFRA